MDTIIEIIGPQDVNLFGVLNSTILYNYLELFIGKEQQGFKFNRIDIRSGSKFNSRKITLLKSSGILNNNHEIIKKFKEVYPEYEIKVSYK